MARVREHSGHSTFPHSMGTKANHAKPKKLMYLKNRLYIMNPNSFSGEEFDFMPKTNDRFTGAKCKKTPSDPFFWKLLLISCNTFELLVFTSKKPSFFSV